MNIVEYQLFSAPFYPINVGKVQYRFDTLGTEKSPLSLLDGSDAAAAPRHRHSWTGGVIGHFGHSGAS